VDDQHRHDQPKLNIDFNEKEKIKKKTDCQTSERSKTRKLPPPDVSVTIAKNFELTAQKLPSCALRVMAIFL
jgi:hypothetical protein